MQSSYFLILVKYSGYTQQLASFQDLAVGDYIFQQFWQLNKDTVKLNSVKLIQLLVVIHFGGVFLDMPNHQKKFLAKFSGHTVSGFPY